MSVLFKRLLVDPRDSLTIREQCELLELSRSSYYYTPCEESDENLELMRQIDQIYLGKPSFGRRRICDALIKKGYGVNPKRVRRLMQVMGIQAIYPKPRTTITNKEHKKYPYLLRKLIIERPNQVWCSDITYVPMAKGFLYLVAIMDWYSRYVISWRISNSLESSFCIEALEEALAYGTPQIFNTDKGVQYTSLAFVKVLLDAEVNISMTARGCWDNLMIERLWRTVKYDHIYLYSYEGGKELYQGLATFFDQYNYENPHSALGMKSPAALWK